MMTELPGAVGLSHLTVYPGGGTPHMHLACSESYVVISGSGHVQTLTMNGYKQTPLHPGAVVWFTPGTIHRLVNETALKLVVLMQNSGLPEAGDAVMTFPIPVVSDPGKYAAAAALPPGKPGDDGYADAAFLRRELAVSGFEHLRQSAVQGDLEPLRRFHAAAINLVRPLLGAWRDRWQKGARHATQATGRHIETLADGAAPHLSDAEVFAHLEPTETMRRGMCGLLNTYAIDR